MRYYGSVAMKCRNREKVKTYLKLRNANDVWELKLIVGRDKAQVQHNDLNLSIKAIRKI